MRWGGGEGRMMPDLPKERKKRKAHSVGEEEREKPSGVFVCGTQRNNNQPTVLVQLFFLSFSVSLLLFFLFSRHSSDMMI